MRQKAQRRQDAAERTINDIRRQTRKRFRLKEKYGLCWPGFGARRRHLAGISRAYRQWNASRTLPSLKQDGMLAAIPENQADPVRTS